MNASAPRAMDVARYLAGYLETHGYCPSFSEIGRGCGMRSKASVSRNLDVLIGEGVIDRIENRARALCMARPVAIPRAPDGAPLRVVPMIGVRREVYL